MTTAQRVSFWSSVALFAFVIVGRLLWGAALGEHGGAWLDVGRDAVLAKEPTAIRIRAVERTLGAARQEVGEVAEAIGAATAERDTVVRQLAQFVHSEKEDRELLAQLHDSLADLDSRGVTTVTIGRDAFTKSDLEHEAFLIFDRIRARDVERAQCVEQQSELDGHLAELREELRKQQRRINDIELAQTRTRRLADRKEQMNGMHGKPLSNDALAIAEQESSQLVKELEEDIVAATLIDQVNGGNSTPAATALQQVGNTSVSVIEQIERVLSEERSTK